MAEKNALLLLFGGCLVAVLVGTVVSNESLLPVVIGLSIVATGVVLLWVVQQDDD
ncbi:hypothetical protein [Halospeciosus flavus]|uniref:Uncharacterized protein n=1 Tax=Halospeciosus flavus TaxID=3032283 RepID=A0ABD5YYV9_9EURY